MNNFNCLFKHEKMLKKILKSSLLKITTKIFFIIIFITEGSFAQWYPNGSQAGSNFINTVKLNIDAEKSVLFDSILHDLNVTLTIEVFVVISKDGKNHFDTTNLTEAIKNANQYFKNIGIQFKSGSYDSVPEYEYAVITNRDSTDEILVKYAKPDKINLFLVDSIVLDKNNYFGYSYFPDKKPNGIIFLRKDFVFGNNLTALLGNCFGLLLTHETGGGWELVSGENCSKSGDFLCDTYADGGLYSFVSYDCRYTGMMIDKSGKYFEPSVANIMSDSPDWCKCLFTEGQYRRVKYYYLKYLQHLK
jgi:hypothetical protein